MAVALSRKIVSAKFGTTRATNAEEESSTDRSIVQPVNQLIRRSSSPFNTSPDMAERAKLRAQMRKLQAARMLSGSGSGKEGTSMPRVPRRDGSDFPSVVLALPARNILPEMQLPPRKRTLFRCCKNIELEEEEEAANDRAAPEQEKSGETKGDDCNKNKSAQCMLKGESSIPVPDFESLSIQENAEELPPVKQDEEVERKPDQPKNEGSKSPQGESSGNS